MITRNITGPRIQELFPKRSDPGTGEFVRAIGKFGLKGIRLACLRSLSLWKTALVMFTLLCKKCKYEIATERKLGV